MSITRAVVRAGRNWPSGVRSLTVLTLGVALAVGVVAVTPGKAYAATELRAPLPTGVDIPSPLVADGSSVVVGAHRSTNAGGTWSSDETLTTMHESGRWLSAPYGTLYGVSAANQAIVYALASGTPVTYTLPAVAWTQMSSSWVLSTTETGGIAYDYLAGGSITSVNPPTNVVYGSLVGQLGSSGALVWHGTSADSHSVFAVASTPTVSPSAWTTIDGIKDWAVSGAQLVYALDTASGLQLCTRPLANLASTPTCLMVWAGSHTSYGADLSVAGSATYVDVVDYATGAASWYLSYGTTVVPLQVPSGSTIDQTFLGDTLYAVVRDASSVPSLKKVNLDGTLSAGFTTPSEAVASVKSLAVAPGRVVGADDRDASSVTFPAWSRTVSSSAFDTETPLPKRASGLAASAGRTALSSSDGLTMLDRGVARYTFSDAHLGAVSGPYVAQTLLDTLSNPYVQISKVDGTKVAAFMTWSGVLFGSRYLSFAPDASITGSTRVTTLELNSGVSDPTVTLVAGSAGCSGWVAWNDLVAGTCDTGHAVRVYNATTGALVTSQGSSATLLSVTELGDGYALLYGTYGSQLWNLATGDLTQLVDCQSWTLSDGVGHVACASSSELIWRDYSSLSTSAGRVLGWSAPATFATDVPTWTPEIDVSKPFNAGTLTISQNSTVVRVLTVPASADGSLRGVSWDGKNASGVVLSSGTFTAQLSVTSADGSGAVKAIDGLAAPTFQLSRTIAGSFTALTPSRLLDTRDGTGAGVAPLGASGVVDLQVAGRGGVPASGVGAVILNVTAVSPSGSGFLTAYPTGGAVPNASNLNFTAGQSVPNLVVAKVGTGGKVSIRNTSPGTTHVVADVAGYFVDGIVTDAGGLAALTPSRLLDTRNTGIVGAGGAVVVQAAGRGGVPASGVAAVVVNLTAVSPASSGYLTAYPTGGAVPNASNVNFTAGQVVPNLAFVKLGADGSFTVRNGSAGATHVVADVAGYVVAGTPTGPGMYVPLSPSRVLDTRPAYGGSGALGSNAARALTVAGVGGVPATGVSGVVLNVTAVASAAGFLTVYPADVGVPNASNVNFTTGQVVPNLVAVKTSAAGAVAIRNASLGATNVIADVAGYFTG